MPNEGQGKREIKLRSESIPVDTIFFKYMNGRERLGHPFKFELVFDCKNTELQPDDVLDRQMTIALQTAKGEEQRQFSGIVTRFSILESSGVFARRKGHERYVAVIRPRLWRLTTVSHCRFFHDLTVTDIAARLLEEYGVDYDMEKVARSNAYPKLDHCVQYRETDFDFLNRLLQREGIYYYFVHQNDKDVMVLADKPADHGPVLGGDSEIPYGVSPSRYLGEKIYRWRSDLRVVTELSKVSAFDFTNVTSGRTPATYSEAGDKEKKTPYSIEDYALRYLSVDGDGNGRRLAQVRLDERGVRAAMAAGECNVGKMWPGGWFRMSRHPRSDQNREYLVTEADYELRMDAESRFARPLAEMKYRAWTRTWVERWVQRWAAWRADEKDKDEIRGIMSEPLFRCTFRAIPRNQSFRSECWAPSPSMGPQTAIVVAPDSDPYVTEKYGQIKVQFHWEQFNPPSASQAMQRCWVRVAQPWAGDGFGTFFLPRKGQEVLVDFLNGDPDKPVVVGGLYNGKNKPPYVQPDAAAVSTILTQGTGTENAGKRNELRFNDEKLQVLLYTDGNQDNYVQVDSLAYVGRDAHTLVENSQRIEAEYQHISVGKSQMTQAQDVSLKASLDVVHEAGDKYVIKSQVVNINAGAAMVLEASAELSLKVGSSFITLTPAALFISGPEVLINSGGAAGKGIGGSTKKPDRPKKADDGKSVKRN